MRPCQKKNNLTGTLTSLVIYITCNKGRTTKTIIISFVLGKHVVVNAIIGKLIINKWRAKQFIDEDFLVSKLLNTKFALKYRIANSGMPVNVKFNSKDLSYF